MSGIYLHDATGARITRNWIHANGGHFNLDHGIYWFSGDYGLVADNIVQHNYANGIKLAPDAQAVRVVENTVDGNGRSGILVGGDSTYTSSNNIVANNILTNNGWNGGGFGLRTYWESLGVGIGNQADSNLLYGNASGAIWADFGPTVLGSLLQDPLFVNRTAGDFHVSAASPAVAPLLPPTPSHPTMRERLDLKAPARTSEPTSVDLAAAGLALKTYSRASPPGANSGACRRPRARSGCEGSPLRLSPIRPAVQLPTRHESSRGRPLFASHLAFELILRRGRARTRQVLFGRRARDGQEGARSWPS
jgi:Right handed beta helix region